MIALLITIIGLCLFEIVCGIDNAVINANILKTVQKKQRKFFLTWGLLIAVFIVRGVFPFLIVWLANSSLNLQEVFTAFFTDNEVVVSSFQKSKPMLLLAGGSYLFLIFLSWFFLEEKKYALRIERFVYKYNVWFYAWASLFTTTIVFFSIKTDPILALGATIGISFFFLVDGFKQNAEKVERELISKKTKLSNWSKIFYLEVLDASFSIDGVIGAFAFTTAVPLILIGNGLGAVIVRKFTMKAMRRIAKYTLLKNGAMYSIGFLGLIMLFESFGLAVPFFLAPAVTFLMFSIFLFLSKKRLKSK